MKINYLLLFVSYSSFSQDTTYFANETGVVDKIKAKYYTLDHLSDSCRITLFDVKSSKKFVVLGLKLKKTNNSTYYISEGETTYFYPNGIIKEYGLMKDNQRIGLWKGNYSTNKHREILVYDTIEAKDFMVKYPFKYKVVEYYAETGEKLVNDGNGKYTVQDSLNIFTVELNNGLADGNGFGVSSKMSFEEIYKNGELIEGIRINKEGEKIKYSELEKNPEFNGGIKAMYQFIAANLKYPRDAQKKNKQGKVFIKFVVEKDGEIKQTEVLKGVYPSIDEEAMRVVKLMSYKFSPGVQRGIPVRVFFTMPIIFLLD